MMTVEHLTGAEAIARGAYEFGIVQPGSIIEEVDSLPSEKCNCMAVAKAIVKKHFEQIHPRYATVSLDEVWSQIERDARAYQSEFLEGPHGSKKLSGDSGSCNKFAPKIFDLILQHIQRYS
jgi:hypothetical protein